MTDPAAPQALSLTADLGPPRSELGVGALMPWAGRLWGVTYVSHTRTTGTGAGLFEVDRRWRLRRRPEAVDGTYANRMIHHPTNQLILGPHVIDARGRVRTVRALADVRLAAVAEHRTDPARQVHVLGMEGEFLDLDVRTLAVRRRFDLTRELRLPAGAQPHFKGAFTAGGRVIVTNNTYDETEFRGKRAAGRLAEWDGGRWRVVDDAPHLEVFGRRRLGGAVFATGWDRASAILHALVGGRWTRYRLPKASHAFEHFWQSEWQRIREIEHERFLLDLAGMFYELSPHAFAGRIWGVRPVATHLRVVPDFCHWRGRLVLGGNHLTAQGDDNVLNGAPEASLWFGDLDDLWRRGKPAGWGGPWAGTRVRAGKPSDPFLLTGFDGKCLHLSHDAGRAVTFRVEVDAAGWGDWRPYGRFRVAPRGAVQHAFPAGFAAHWLRVTADRDAVATALLHFT